MNVPDPGRVTALSHQLLSAVTPGASIDIEVGASPSEVSAIVQASGTVIGCLLKWLAAEIDIDAAHVAAELHTDLLLLSLDAN